MAQSIYDQTLKEIAEHPAPGAPGPGPAPSIYEKTFLETQEGQESQLRTSMKTAVETTPERAGQVQQLADRVGLPASVVERNFDQIRKRAQVEETEYTRLLKSAPKLSTWLTENPAHAAVAQNELPRLRQVEELLTFTGSLRRGVDVTQGSYYASLEVLGEAVDSDRLIAYGREGRRRNAAEAEARGGKSSVSEVRTFGDFTQWAKETIGEQIPIMAPTVGGAVAGAAIGSFIPIVGTVIGGFVGAFAPALVFGVGDVAASVKERGEDARAPLAVFIGGTAIAAFDVVVPGKIGSRLVKLFGGEVAEEIAERFFMKPVTESIVSRTAKGTAEGMLTEGVTEALQEAIGEISAAKGTGTPVSPDIWKQMFEAGAAGALMGGAVSMTESSFTAVHERRRSQAAAAQHQANVLNTLGERLAGSEAAGNLPAAVESFLASATSDGPLSQVYAPVVSWTEYWQSKGMDPSAVASKLTGDPKAYETSVRTGEDLVIPMARYAANLAGTEHNAFLAQELRFRPGEMNAREAVEYQAQLEVDLDAQDALPKPAVPVPTPADEIRSNIVQQLERSGIPTGTAQQYAQLYESVFANLGARAGVDPVELFNRYGLNIERPGLPSGDPAGAAFPLTAAISSTATPADVEAEPLTPVEVQQLERRAEAEAPAKPPTGVAERRKPGMPLSTDPNAPENQPIAAMESIGAAATRMLQEDPNLLARALEMRERAMKTPRVKAPREGAVDTGVAEAEDVTDVTGTEAAREGARAERRPAISRVTESTPPGRAESRRAFQTRRTEHYAEVFSVLEGAALGLDPKVDIAALRTEFNDRVEMIESLDDEWKDSGHNPRKLLETIAAAGGISIESEKKGGGNVGELRWIRESTAMGAFGAFGGVRGVWRAREPGRRLARQGLTLDDMVRMLNQDPQFDYIADINDLLLALEDVARLESGRVEGQGVTLPGTDELARRAGMNPFVKWWASSAETEFGQERALFEEDAQVKPTLKVRVGTRLKIRDQEWVVAPQGEKGSAVRGGNVWLVKPERVGQEPLGGELLTLTVTELRQMYGSGELTPVGADVLDTGEVQPRLPGEVGAVREEERAQPVLDAAFALTSEVAKPKGVQRTLFQSAFHGSAAIFDQFSLHAIGTGEGAQAYGWGLYFASKREVADYYRETLAGKEEGKALLVDGKPPYQAFYKTLTDELRAGLAEVYSRAHWLPAEDPKAIQKMRRDLAVSIENVRALLAEGQTMSGDAGMDRVRLSQYETGLAFLDAYGDKITIRGPVKPGRTYKVEIPDLEDFLQWDLPASRQSAKVQAVLKDLGVDFTRVEIPTRKRALQMFNTLRVQRDSASDIGIRESLREGLYYLQQASLKKDGSIDDQAFAKWYYRHAGLLTGKGINDPVGETLYNDLKVKLLEEHREKATGAVYTPPMFGEMSEAASRLLSSKGIAGLAYLDQFSRAARPAYSGDLAYLHAAKGFETAEAARAGLEQAYKDAPAEELEAAVAEAFDEQPAQTHNYVVFDDKLVQITEYYQARAPQLAAIHQLSAENLTVADRMGGLALPSIAVTTAEHGALKGYGEITLIGGRELADPSIVPVFDADAYTATFPQPEYGKAKMKPTQAVVDRFRAIAAEFDDGRLTDEIWENAINKPNPRESVGHMRRSLAVQAAFLREQGITVEPVMQPRQIEAGFVTYPAFQKFLQEEGLKPNFAYDDLEYRKKLTAAVSAAINEQIAAEASTPEMAEMWERSGTRNWIDEDGLVPFGYTLRLERSVAAIGAFNVAYGETRAIIEPLLADKIASFQAWIDDLILPLYPEPKLTLGRKKVDYTLPNIVEKMLSGKLNAEQDTLVFGEGKARAAAATRFTDLEWMRNASFQIQPEGVEDAREKAKALTSAWRDQVVGHYTGTDWKGNVDTWHALDASMRALARWAKTRRGSPQQRLRAALGREGFVGVPAAVIEQGIEAGRAFLEAPVPYFESKPQRRVELGEFQGAVIPESAAQETRDLLDKNGIPYVTYPTEDQRDSVLRTFRDELAARGREVLFQARRGSIRFGSDRQFNLQLFANADLSTFLHESGHFYLEVLADLADKLTAVDPSTLVDTQRQLVGDYGHLLEWLGVENRSELKAEHHEKFARAFELYLMEGKSPSIALRSTFAKFRAWLIGVYRSVTGLRVALRDDVRAIMDRLVATDEAIADAEAEAQIAPMFTTAQDAGMSDQEFGLYRERVLDASTEARERLGQKLLAEVQREQQAEWKRQRAVIREVVEREIYERREYQALSAMQRGTYPDGSPLQPGEEPQPLKLSRVAIVREFGAPRLKMLPRPYIYTTEGGMEPSTAAELFGYSSGDELLRALAGVEPMRRAIERETDNRMMALNGSILLDGSLHEKAQAAVANEVREQVVRTELRVLADLRRTVRPHVEHAVRAAQRERSYERRWLEAEARLRIAIAEGRKQVEIDALRGEIENLKRKALGGPAAIAGAIPPQQVITNTARQRIAATRIKDIRPQLFWSAARRAGQAAIDSAARQDFEAAIIAKQQELLNLALYREASTALDDAEARVRDAKALGQPAARKRLGIAGESYLDQIDGILDRFEFATVPNTVLERRAGLRRWVAALEGEGLPVDLPEELLDEARRVNHRELTYEELVGVSDGLKHIVHLARLKNRLLKTKAARELNELAGDIATSIKEKTTRRRERKIELRLPADERARMVAGVFAAHRKMSSLARELDGFEDGGLMWENIIKPLNDAGNTEAEMTAAATKTFGALVQEAFPGRQKSALYTKRFIPAIGESLAKMNTLMVALNWGNDGNRQRVKGGYKWSDTQVQAILDTLDGRDWRFVQGVWDAIDAYWPEIAAKQERVYGIAPEKVDATPFDTPFGRMRGGYFPIKYDERQSARAGELADLESASFAKQAAYVKATTRRGHTEARQTKVFMPVRLDFGVIFEHVSQVIHDLSHHEALIDVGRVLGHKAVQSAVYETQGDIVYRQFKTGVLDVAFGDRPATNAFERAINHLRAGATIAGLGWNLVTGMLQPIGLTQSAVRIGPKWVARGFKRWLRDAAHMENTVHWIVDRSSLMKHRFSTQQREINEIRNKLGVNTGKLGGWVDEILKKTTLNTVERQDVADSFFYLIQVMQRIADVPTWLGAYEKAMEGGKDEETAIAIADQAVLDSQAGGQIKDLSAVQRGGPMMRLWTNFYSFFSSTYNLAAESRRRRDLRKPTQVGRLAVDYLMLFILPATLSYGLYGLLGRNDDEDPVVGVIRANISYAMGSMLGLRELSGAVQGYFGYEGPAGARFFASASRFVKQAEQGELDAAFWRSLNDVSGMIFHYPAGQVKRTLEGVAAVAEGKAGPQAVLVGPPKE